MKVRVWLLTQYYNDGFDDNMIMMDVVGTRKEAMDWLVSMREDLIGREEDNKAHREQQRLLLPHAPLYNSYIVKEVPEITETTVVLGFLFQNTDYVAQPYEIDAEVIGAEDAG